MKIEECFFVDSKLKDIQKKYCEFKFEKVVLSNNLQRKKYEGESNNYYKIIKLKDKYRIYYRASNNEYMINGKFNNNYNYDLENLCVAESNDGLNFDKINVNKNNIIKKKDFCHNFFPNYINNKFMALSGTKLKDDGLHLFESNDGLNWDLKNKILDENNILQFFKHKNHFDTHNSINYNNLDKFYYLHTRHNNFDDKRKVQVIKTYDLKTLLDPELINIDNNYNHEIYNLNVDKLNYHEYFVAIPNYGESKIIKNIDNKDFMIKNKYIKNIIVSKDGINFKTLIPDIKLNNINNYNQVCPVNGLGCSKDNKKLFFYFQNNVHTNNHEIQCYSIPYNRFIEYYSLNYGYIKTKKLKLRNFSISINFKTKSEKKSYIIVEIINLNNERLRISKMIKGDKLSHDVEWFPSNNSLEEECYIKFHLHNASLFSFTYQKKHNISLDYIWSKGVYNRDSYMLRSTNCSCNEEDIINIIKKNNDYMWIRNSNNRHKIKDLDYLANNLDKLTKNKILIIGDGDDDVPRSYSNETINKILNCKKINNIYIQNYDHSIEHPKLKHYPIGLDLHTPKFLLNFNYEQKIKYYIDVRKSDTDYILNKVFCDTHLSESHPDRKIMFKKLKKNRFIDFLDEKLNFMEIIKRYRNYRFVLSPRGNGLDCHRTWELFLLGCIVITETSPLDQMWKENKLPVIILNDYNELNISNLHLRLEFWYKRYKDLVKLENILPKFKNSYWLNTK